MRIYNLISVLGLSTLSMSIVSCNSGNVSLNTVQEKASYAIGLQIGKSLKAQNAEVVVPALVAGINDSIGGKEAKLKQPDIDQAMQKMQEMMMKKAQEVAEKNLKEGDAFLAKNKAKPGVKTTESGLQIEMTKEGTGAMPTDTDKVKVHYTGTLITGEKFDSSRDRNEPAEFPVRGVIPGWTEALKMMKAGSTAKLVIPAKLAYGPNPRPGIPANSTLLFDVELIEVSAVPQTPPMPPQMMGNPHKAEAPGKKKKK